MVRPCSRAAATFAALLTLLVPVVAHAEWLPNGNPVCTFSLEQWVSSATADAQGGAFVSWKDASDTRIQRFTASGSYAAGWPDAGLRLEHLRWGPHARLLPNTLVPDGTGGTYAVSFDGACGNSCYFDVGCLFVRRITAQAELAAGWPVDGLPVEDGRLEFGVQGHMQAVPRSRGGLLVAWTSNHPGQPGGPRRVIAQALASDGTRRWGNDGLVLALGTGVLSNVALVDDADGGAFVFWGSLDTATAVLSVRGQHVGPSGRMLWSATGLVVSRTPLAAMGSLAAVTDGDAGAIVAWAAARPGSATGLDVFAARVSSRGESRWHTTGSLCAAPGSQDDVRLVPTRDGGAVAAWLDPRAGSDRRVYAQRIRPDGHAVWSRDGAPVCAHAGDHALLALAADGAEGAFVAWSDTRAEGKLYATRLTGDGEPARGWDMDGSRVSGWLPLPYGTNRVENLVLAPLPGRRALVAWTSEELAPDSTTALDLCRTMLLTPDGPAAGLPSPQKPVPPAEPAGAPPAVTWPAFALYGVSPNPATAGSTVSFALPESRGATLELFDVAGRRVWAREVGELGAGEHAVRLRDGIASPPGLYLVRLRQGARVATARVMIVGSSR